MAGFATPVLKCNRNQEDEEELRVLAVFSGSKGPTAQKLLGDFDHQRVGCHLLNFEGDNTCVLLVFRL